jgi:hypothetical protein
LKQKFDLSILSSLTIDEDSHTYSLGKRKPMSVTQILDMAGLYPEWAKNEHAARFGRIGHKIMDLFVNHRLGDYDKAFDPWMTAIKKFCGDWMPRPVHTEKKLYSFSQDYAGTLDFYGFVYDNFVRHDNMPVIMDWKFWSQKTKQAIACADVQTEAYYRASRENELLKTGYRPKRYVVWFREHRYEVIPLTDISAWSNFVAAKVICAWKEKYA